MRANPNGYDMDVIAWANEQARLLRAGRFGLDHGSGRRPPSGVQGFSLGLVHPRLKPWTPTGGRGFSRSRSARDSSGPARPVAAEAAPTASLRDFHGAPESGA